MNLRKKKLTDDELLKLLENSSDEESDFSDDSIADPNFSRSCIEKSDEELELEDETNENIRLAQNLDEENIEMNAEEHNCIWNNEKNNFIPRKNIPNSIQPTISNKININSTELDVFFNIFPKSLFLKIADCTNKRIDILNRKIYNESRKLASTSSTSRPKPTIQSTDSYEIMVVIGIYLVMSYNRVPHIHMYWSQNPSLGNTLIKTSIGRDRFLLLSSKLYFNDPDKPSSATSMNWFHVFRILSKIVAMILQSSQSMKQWPNSRADLL